MMNDNTQRSSMNPTQNNNITYEDKSTIRRNLTVSERQAYEGARLFYYSVFPTSIIFIMVLHVHLYEESRVDHSQLKEYPIGYIISLIVFACLSFLLAARQYYLCNKIETSPLFVLGSEFSLVEENTIRSEPGDNTPLQPSLKPPKHFCKQCQHLCNYRSRHCHKCQICIQKYDHHCFWIGNCVGRHNHRNFYYFLALQSVCNWLGWVALHEMSQICDYYEMKLSTFMETWRIGFMCLAVGFIVFTGYLWLYHSMLIASSMTTWQHMRRDRISYLKYLPKGYNPFSRGILQNCKQFFTSQTNTNIIHQQEQMLPAYQQRKLLKPTFNIIDNQYYSCC